MSPDADGAVRAEGPHRAVVAVLFALAHVDGVAVDQRRHIQAAQREAERPDRLAGPRLEGPHRAVARTEDHQRLPLDHRQKRRAVGRIVGQRTGAVDPYQLARGLVEGHEAMRRPGQLAPAGRHRADDDQVVEDDRHVRAAAVGAEQAEFFAK